MEAEGNFVKIAAIGVYLEDAAVPALAGKWAGKTADELASDPPSSATFTPVSRRSARSSAHRRPATGAYVTCGLTISRTGAGEFEKLTRVTFIWPKTVAAEEFAAKVMESRVAYLKATGAYTDAEAAAVEEFKAAFKSHSLAPVTSRLPEAGPLTSGSFL
jgi:chalcone isomerase